MKLTGFTDYSLRVLIFLAAVPGRRSTIAEIAKTFDASESHLMKVVHFLGQQGWLANVRGKGGGLELGMATDKIIIGRVVRATEGVDLPAECFGPNPDHCAIARVCRLRLVLRDAINAFYDVLDEYTLADLVKNRSTLAKVLQISPQQ